jgi:ribosomal protein S18 acetylase RimI-like enzyme
VCSVRGVIATVTDGDLPELLPLMRGYCDFYEVDPPDEELLAMSRALIADPDREGTQLIARDEEGRATGFATIFWTWSTLSASRVGVMNDLFVAEWARGTGVVEALIAACAERSRRHGATSLDWTTARDNRRAQRVYDRIGAQRDERWVDYSLAVLPEPANPDS